jgi:hypothetical protein
MKSGMFIDGNVWNFLFDRNLDLAVELPSMSSASLTPAKPSSRFRHQMHYGPL